MDSFLWTDCSLPASLTYQHGLLNSYLVAQCLGHIVNRQGGNARPCQRFHLDARLVRHTTFTSNDGRVSILQVNIDIHLIQWQCMAQWNQLARLSVNEDQKYECTGIGLTCVRNEIHPAQDAAQQTVKLTWQP
jgi:hypothetical protein